jgi:hypothetical protein
VGRRGETLCVEYEESCFRSALSTWSLRSSSLGASHTSNSRRTQTVSRALEGGVVRREEGPSVCREGVCGSSRADKKVGEAEPLDVDEPR